MKLLLAFVMLAGCDGIPREIPGGYGELVIVDYDEDFENEIMTDGKAEAEGVRAGIHYWNDLGANMRTQDELTNVPSNASHYHIKRDSFSWPGVNAMGLTMPGLGYSTIYPSVLRNYGMWTWKDMRQTVAHELGHAIGMNHVDGKGVMNKSDAYYNNDPSELDMDEYLRNYPKR